MDPLATSIILIVLEVSTILTFVIGTSLLVAAVSVANGLRGRSGGRLAGIIVGVLVGFVAAELVSSVAALGLVTGVTTQENGIRALLFLAQQMIFVIVAAWTARRLSRI